MRRTWRWALLPVVGLFVGGLVTRADALVVCAAKNKKTGELKEGASVKLRTACKANEVQVDPAEAGLQGPPGAGGADGADGSPGLSGVEVVTANGGTIISGYNASSATAECQGGKSVIGGGVALVQLAGGSLTSGGVTESRPVTTTPQGWAGTIVAQSTDDWRAQVYAICATVTP